MNYITFTSSQSLFRASNTQNSFLNSFSFQIDSRFNCDGNEFLSINPISVTYKEYKFHYTNPLLNIFITASTLDALVEKLSMKINSIWNVYIGYPEGKLSERAEQLKKRFLDMFLKV